VQPEATHDEARADSRSRRQYHRAPYGARGDFRGKGARRLSADAYRPDSSGHSSVMNNPTPHDDTERSLPRTDRTRGRTTGPRRKPYPPRTQPNSRAAVRRFSPATSLRRHWHSAALGMLLTTVSLYAGCYLLRIEPSVTLELLLVAVGVKAGLWLHRTTTALAPSSGRRSLVNLLRDEALIGLALLAAGFVRHWALPVESVMLIAAVNLALHLIWALGFELWAKLYKRPLRPTPDNQVTQRVVIVGTGLRARRLADKFLDHPELQTGITGFMDFERTDLWRYRDIPLLGHPRSFERLALSQHIDALVMAVGPEEIAHTATLFANAERMGIAVWLLPDLYQAKLSRGTMTTLDGSPAVVYQPTFTNPLVCGIKELFDRTAASLIMTFGFPVFLLTALAIKLDSRGPIFFRQERMGRNGRRFMLYKFRTMACDAERKKRSLLARNEMTGPVFKIKDDPRITRIGHLLRKYSVDEFPQLLNILRGEMSLVGPRPPLPAEVTRFEPWQRRKLSVKPGLTCLWQVNGRNAIDFDHWMRLDLEYIDNWSLWLDARILAKTVPTVLKGTGL
jgi:exopolysaccharide biosynthesis polyprenyl glycosylphosphotransferase